MEITALTMERKHFAPFRRSAAEVVLRFTEPGLFLTMDIDEILHLVGNLGRFQFALVTLFCLMEFPNGLLIMSPYFTETNPSWRCSPNSAICNMNGTFSIGDSGYKLRCNMPRSAWEFVKPKEFSVVTQVGQSYITLF